MARFVPNQTIATRTPTVSVDAGLAVGTHTFQLVVVDDAGHRSAPARLVVEVLRSAIGGGGRRPLRPTPP
jgi:hypothetical protein